MSNTLPSTGSQLKFDATWLTCPSPVEPNGAEFAHRVANRWPFGEIVAIPRIDADVCLPARWWKGTPAGWSKLQTWIRALENSLSEQHQQVLLLDCDVAIHPDLPGMSNRFVNALPPDWSLAVMGGRIRLHETTIPRRVNEFVFVPGDFDSVSGVALRGTTTIASAYQHLCGLAHRRAQHHSEYPLNRFHSVVGDRVFCPSEWLFRDSAPTERSRSSMFELDPHEFAHQPMAQSHVAVCVPFCAGGAGIVEAIHELGVDLGASHATNQRPKDLLLNKICESSFSVPALDELRQAQRRRSLIAYWAMSRATQSRSAQSRAKQSESDSIVGANHPLLCMMVDDLVATLPNLKIITLQRPIYDLFDNFDRSPMQGSQDEFNEMTLHLLDKLKYSIESNDVDHFWVAYYGIQNRPRVVIERLAEFLGLDPDDQQKEAATNALRKSPTYRL